MAKKQTNKQTKLGKEEKRRENRDLLKQRRGEKLGPEFGGPWMADCRANAGSLGHGEPKKVFNQKIYTESQSWKTLTEDGIPSFYSLTRETHIQLESTPLGRNFCLEAIGQTVGPHFRWNMALQLPQALSGLSSPL